MRECREEADIELKMCKEFFRQGNEVNDIDESLEVEWIYYDAVSLSDKVKISWEHDQYKWVEPKDLLEFITYSVQRDAFDHLDLNNHKS